MSRFNNRDRPTIIMLLMERDGNKCQYKGCPMVFTSLDQIRIHHVIPVKEGGTNRLSNLLLYCHAHNIQDGFETSLTDVRVRDNGSNDGLVPESMAERLQDDKTITATMRKNRRCEKPFRAWFIGEIEKGLEMEWSQWEDAGAEKFECSQSSINRYLQKLCSISGRYIPRPGNGGRIILQKKYSAMDYENYIGSLEYQDWFMRMLAKGMYDENGNRRGSREQIEKVGSELI